MFDELLVVESGADEKSLIAQIAALERLKSAVAATRVERVTGRAAEVAVPATGSLLPAPRPSGPQL